MSKFLFTAAAIVFLSCAPAQAADKPENFLPPDALDLTAILPPPPANDSPVTRAELAEIHRVQAGASAAQNAQAKADTQEDAYVFASVLGANFTAGKLPAAAPFLEHVREAEKEFVDPAKKALGRPRPPLVDSTIATCETLRPSGAYPSGHATTGYLFAVVLAQIVPEKREQIFSRAAEYANNRVLCGVHYPSDVEAGKISGSLIGAMLLQNPAFKAELGPAKAEIRRVLGLPSQ
jgi:acid phosphatase (class A)